MKPPDCVPEHELRAVVYLQLQGWFISLQIGHFRRRTCFLEEDFHRLPPVIAL
jgi:hypothetical protein